MEKTITIAIVGPPNVGKSSFINAILNDQVCIVSSTPHSTQCPVMAVHNYKDTQITFIDTPGITDKKPLYYLNDYASHYLNKCDVVLFLFDASKSINMQLLTLSASCEVRKIAVFTKIDKVNKRRLLPKTGILAEEFRDIHFISNATKHNIDFLLDEIIKDAKEGAWSDIKMTTSLMSMQRQLDDRAQEIIFKLFKNEIPYNLLINTNVDDNTISQVIFGSSKYRPILLGKYSLLKRLIKKNIEFFLHIKINYELQFKFEK